MAKLGREARKRRGRAPKIEVVAQLTELLKSEHGFILVNNRGLSVAQATELRAKFRENNVAFKMVKNTLLKRALDDSGVDSTQFDDLLKRETMIAIGHDEPVTPAKVLTEFLKNNEDVLEIKGGYLDGKVIDPAGVEALSKLPSKEELIAKMLGSLQAPTQNLVYALYQTVAKVVYAVDAHRRKLEDAA